MAYTASKYFSIKPLPYPAGQDNAQRTSTLRGTLSDQSADAINYTVGGVGSSSFQITAFSAVGLVTYNSLIGLPLQNGQKIVAVGTTHNDGTYIVSKLTPATSVSGTFVAVPLPGHSLDGTGDTAQTAEGVGGLQWGAKYSIPQTFTVTAVTVSAGVMTCTYTTLTGPQLSPRDPVTLAAFTNAGNDGSFTINTVVTTSATAGSFTVANLNAVASDSGTGTGFSMSGFSENAADNSPVEVRLTSTKGFVYIYDTTNNTIRIFATGTASGDALNEIATGANATFDNTVSFAAVFERAQNS
jgi:hypothetical protein